MWMDVLDGAGVRANSESVSLFVEAENTETMGSQLEVSRRLERVMVSRRICYGLRMAFGLQAQQTDIPAEDWKPVESVMMVREAGQTCIELHKTKQWIWLATISNNEIQALRGSSETGVHL